LKQVAEKLGKRLAGHTCAAMKGLLEEGSEWIGEDAVAEVMDAGIIAAAQRVEHYEMAGYGTVQTFAKLLGEKEAAELFTLTLNEEKAADKKLSLLAKAINVKAKAEKPPAGVKIAVKNSANFLSNPPLEGSVRSRAAKVIWRRNRVSRNESLTVHLDAEEGAFGARSPKRVGLPKRPRYNPTRSLELCCSSPRLGRLCPRIFTV
jgi:Domain of unknown function (DUF892)